MFDNPRVRGLYTSLGDGWTYLNAQDSPQIPERVAAAVNRSFRAAPITETPDSDDASILDSAASRHARRMPPGARRGETFVASARTAIADLVGARPECVFLGASRAALLERLALAMPRTLGIGNDVVVSRIDDPESIRPWLRAANLYGARVRWAEPDLSTGELPAWQFGDIVRPSTAVVAVSAANRFIGSVTDVRRIAAQVDQRTEEFAAAGATPTTGLGRPLMVVDVDSFLPTHVLSMSRFGADVVAFDMASLGGPALGVLVVRDVDILEDIFPAHFFRFDFPDLPHTPGSTANPHSTTSTTANLSDPAHSAVTRARTVLEFGSLSEGLIGAVPTVVDHWAAMTESSSGTRRTRLKRGMPQAARYTLGLTERLIEGLCTMPHVQVLGVDKDDIDAAVTGTRIPRVSFLVQRVPGDAVHRRLLSHGVVVGMVRPGESELLHAMGAFEAPGACALSVGVSVFNTAHDIDQLLRAVASL